MQRSTDDWHSSTRVSCLAQRNRSKCSLHLDTDIGFLAPVVLRNHAPREHVVQLEESRMWQKQKHERGNPCSPDCAVGQTICNTACMFAAHNYLACNPHRARSFYLALACVLPNVKWCHLSWQTFFHGSGSQSPNIRMELGRFHMLSTRPGPTSQGYGQQAQKNMAPFQGHSGAMALTSDERNTVCLDITVQMSSFCSGGLSPRWSKAIRSEIGDQVAKHQAWHLATSTVTLRGRRDINLRFAWQAWHFGHLAGSGGALACLSMFDWKRCWHVSNVSLWPTYVGSPLAQVPRPPRKTKVDVAKCHACHAKCRVTGDQRAPSAPPEPAKSHKCYACHAKRRLMSPSATPATQSAAASRATNGPQVRHQSQPSRTSATPAMQKEGWCRQVPRLPRKVPRRHGPPTGPKPRKLPRRHGRPTGPACHAKWRWMSPSPTPATQRCVDVAKCHACHAKWWWMSPSGSKLRVSELFVTKLVWASCAWASCVWQSCVCVSKLCVTMWCVTKLCVSKLCEWQSCVVVCVWASCVWQSCVCVTIVCDKVVCERWCVTKLCVCACVWTSCVCVRGKVVWLCVCDQVVCVTKLCVTIVCDKVVCDKVVCDKLCVSKLCGTKLCVAKLSVSKLCVWQSCVCEQVVCERERRQICVCDKVVCEQVLCERECVTKLCVCEQVVCEREEAAAEEEEVAEERDTESKTRTPHKDVGNIWKYSKQQPQAINISLYMWYIYIV